MELTLISLVFGAICFIIVGVKVKSEKKPFWVVIALPLVFGIFFVSLALESFNGIPNGLPPELKVDGLYEVRIVDVYKEKDGSQWVAVQVLKEEGKTIEGLLPYRKISKSKFGNANIVYGIPLTIELKIFPSQQYLTVK